MNNVFNRVNSANKEYSCTMYAEWSSLMSALQTEDSSLSVLNKFSGPVGKDVATAVVKNLAYSVGITAVHYPEHSNLESDKDVQWCMEVICFGLGLPLTEHETIKDCVNVYCEWLTALCPLQNDFPKSIPKPVLEQPNFYARKMIDHLYNLFKPRPDANYDAIKTQVLSCHRVLRILQANAQNSTIMSRETWEAFLLFLLAINNTLLAPPTIKDDISDQLCERVLSVLFEMWLLACNRCFPTPPLWKTFRDVCVLWRHRPALIEQWNRVNVALTSRLLKFMYGEDFPPLRIPPDDIDLVPTDMNNECVAQTWFRFLHTLRNPVDLHNPSIISKTPKFMTDSIVTESDYSQYPCLTVLPQVFLRAMKGIAMLVDAFLGISQGSENMKWDAVKFPVTQPSITPPQQRRIAKSFSHSSSYTTTAKRSKANQSQQVVSHVSSATYSSTMHRRPLAPSRPKCNSILHLFGAWLFEAALIGTDLQNSQTEPTQSGSMADIRRSSGPASFESSDIQPVTNPESYEAGRAEAIGALCRLFSAKKTGEEILTEYLARFYLAVEEGLKTEQSPSGQVLCSILLNSCDLFHLDLDGIQVLLPHFLSALELVLPDQELNLKVLQSVSQTELRRAAIHLLLSLLPLPLHFRNLPIKDLCNSQLRSNVTFQSFRLRLINLLCNALQCEVDSTNSQMLLGGLLLCVQDAAAMEEVSTLQHDAVTETASNLLSSGHLYSHPGGASSASDTVSSRSASDFSGLAFDELDSLDGDICPPYDSAHALFVRATYLVCHRLISSWKTDLNVSLAALELLAGFAKIKIPEQARRLTEAMECKRAVKWICDYIVYQCNRPPPAHSKDLHSTIVAAFHCVTVWLVDHPYLLEDNDCLNVVLEVVELGISGSKSQPKHSDVPCMKGNKESKPASMRVRDAAENALGCILDLVGAFPSPCGPETTSSLLEEETLLCYCNSRCGGTREEAVANFCYYVVENAHLLALLEQPLGNDQDPQPTVTVLNRSPFGRHAWAMQLRHLPRHKSGTKCCAVNPGRPLPMNENRAQQIIKQRYFPECVDRIPQCKAEKSIPLLESLLSDKQLAQDHNKVGQIFDRQVVFEQSVQNKNRSQKVEFPNPETECKAPEVCQEFQTARLFLSHFGFLSLEALKESITCPLPSLVRLDNRQNNFPSDLDTLDGISTRTYDTAYVFYVKAGQKTAEEILANVNFHDNCHLHHYTEFLFSLGWPVNVSSHPGWTGQSTTSWKVRSCTGGGFSSVRVDEEKKGSRSYDVETQVLYWSDFSSEIVFIVPSNQKKCTNDAENDGEGQAVKVNAGFDRMAPERHTMPVNTSQLDLNKPRALSLDLERGPMKEQESPTDLPMKKLGRQYSSVTGCDIKVLIVWLESFEDHSQFPLGDILQGIMNSNEAMRTSDKDVQIIFIHALQSGLFRIHVRGQSSRISTAIPLIDGMVVSRRTLGTVVRQTALNMCRRKRLENDGYQLPHVRRKLKIQEMIAKYGCKTSEAEFYTTLFKSPMQTTSQDEVA